VRGNIESQIKGRESGAVLVAVFFTLVVLGVLVLQFGYLARLDSRLASRYRDSIEASSLARAGINQAIVLLEDDKLTDTEEGEEEEEDSEEDSESEEESSEDEEEETEVDSLQEDWALPQEAVKFGAGQFVFKITDEDRKFNLNRLVEEAIEEVEAARSELLALDEGEEEEEESEEESQEEEEEEEEGEEETEEEEEEKEEEEEEEEEESEEEEKERKMLSLLLEKLDVKLPEEKAESVRDWIDADDAGRAEDQYYAGLDPEYVCKDAPMEMIGELALIKEIDRKLVWGDSPREKIEMLSEEEAEDYYLEEEERFPGLQHYLTVYSDGLVNINTASREVLEVMLGEEYEDLADEIIEIREETPFEELNEVEEKLEEDIPDQLMERFKVSSDYFTILSEGRVGEVTARIRAVVKRLEDKIVIVYWRFE